MDEQMQLDSLEVGESFQFHSRDATFTVRRARENVYVLGASNAPTRSRSGKKDRISQDIDFCKQNGRLPKPTWPRW
jgi:hypothetical protein